VTVADVLTEMIRALRQLPTPVAVTAEELCETLWLYQQGVGSDSPSATSAGGMTSPESRGLPHEHGAEGDPAGQGMESPHAYLPDQVTDSDGGPGAATRIALRDAPALPQARELSRALRPLRFDAVRSHRADGIDEEATALRIAQTGIRDVVWRPTRRRRLDLDLVLDLGGSGVIWKQLAVELRSMLEIQGAFRSVRFWELDSDSAAMPLRPARGRAGPVGTVGYPWTSVYQAPRKPLILVLTDGTGRTWHTKAVYQPLRKWATHGTVLLIQLLPPKMWNRTALPALPVAFLPADDGYHSGRRIEIGHAELYEIGLRRDALPAATAIPVIGLSVAWLRSWLPLMRGSQAGAVPGYALLIPAEVKAEAPHAGPDTKEQAGPRPADGVKPKLTPEQRVQRFMLTASRDARTLARLLSLSPVDLAVMRKIRSELLPESEPEVMAEVMLGGLVFWRSSAGSLAPSDRMKFEFHEGVRELLQERPGGWPELKRDMAQVERAILADRGTGRLYPVVVLSSDAQGRAVQAGVRALASLPEAAPDLRDPAAPVAGSGPEEPLARPVRIGLWGSTQSGRTTFLTILGTLFTGWTNWRRGEQWRVVPVSDTTKHFINERMATLLGERRFPESSTPPLPGAEPMSFRLERRRRRGRGPLGWLWPERMAEITVTLQDRAGAEFYGVERSLSATSYLAESDVLVYFFDPTYDVHFFDPPYDGEPRKGHSADFFTAVETDLGMFAAQQDRLYQRFLPHHIAVCISKLDEQRVFDLARKYGCAETNPRSRLPWVPSRNAKRLFEAIIREQRSIQADELRTRLDRAFDAGRTSYHALSSVGFWVPEGGSFNPADVCNVIKASASDSPGTEPERLLRGNIRPVHVLDPLISLVERATKQAGRP